MRQIDTIHKSSTVMEGAGVRLSRMFSQPEVPKFDPFLLLDDFGSNNPEDYVKGFPWHPHRGIETVTYMLSGEVEHQDSLGNKGVIREGDVQWMTAGSGIVHQEMPKVGAQPLRGIQLWVNLPKEHKMTTPVYRSILETEIPVVQEPQGTVRVIAGRYAGVVGAAENLIVPVTYLDIRLDPGATFSHNVLRDETVVLYVYRGSLTVGDTVVDEKTVVSLTREEIEVRFEADSDGVGCMLISGTPLKEPVSWYGPIVMNTDEEVRQAFIEYNEGGFIKNDPS